jgi:KipI family sensor histidine kinase inhibitor
MSASAPDAQIACEPLGETVLLIRFGQSIDAALNARVHAAVSALRAAALPGIEDYVPAYASLALHYTPDTWLTDSTTPWRSLAQAAMRVLDQATPTTASMHTDAIEIPVHYDGPDLDALAATLGLDIDTLVARHSGGDYRVAMLGFAPGFPYLLGLDPSLHAPRRANPRTRVPRGSVAIGGAQTGIYPSELPGGWQLIGRTPLRLFDAAREPACLLAAGDRVRFRAIGAEEFAALESLSRA